MVPGIAHLHTYFMFPFSLDRQALISDHQDVWSHYSNWVDGLDEWIAVHSKGENAPVVEKIGPWRRSPYTRFDWDSPAYHDMVFFHPFVRRVFFDTVDPESMNRKETLLRCYTIKPRDAGLKLFFEARDAKDRSASVEITDLRMLMFANGIGILTIGVEAFGISAQQALWINEAMRKTYPSSGRQLREGRTPNYMALVVQDGTGNRDIVVEENFEKGDMHGYQPPLAATITSLLYFADYDRQEFEPVLDERMIVFSYVAVDPNGLEKDYLESEPYQVLLSRFLYVDRWGSDYRYDEDFTQRLMRRQLYKRWSHQGTYYGFTSYSSMTACVGTFDCDEHQLCEGFLIHRMFDNRYYLMAIVALFYRATLLDFAERTALVSKRLFLDQGRGRFTIENIRLANDLRADFLHFSNYWYFSELANKDEEIEHFEMQRREYGIEAMKEEIEEEVEKLNASLHGYYQFRNTESINRLAMLSLLFGAGAVLTGFFGMNFGKEFARIFFEPDRHTAVFHYVAVATVAVLALGALAFGLALVIANWQDYRDILVPARWKDPTTASKASLKRLD